MSPDDASNPVTGWAQVPGPRDEAGSRSDEGLPRAAPADRPAGAADRAGVGRATVGRASVPMPSAAVEPMTGRAAVRDPYAPAGAAGRAPSFAARASVPVPGAGPAHGVASVSGAAAVPGAGAGSAQVPGGGSAAGGRSAPARAKRRRRRNIIIAALASFIMITGLGMVGGTYYFDKVALPENLAMDQATSIYYSDGPLLARIGDKNRTVVTFDDIPLHVQHAVVAAEDNSFYTNAGVDYQGVVRAAWNNVTGGDRQGASTISQQYARLWADLEGVTYARKLREAVIALKLNQQFKKDQIMTMYLNIVYFGRGAYGIQAASYAYFNKPAKDLTVAEGMILAGIVKNPEGSGNKGSPFDPTVDKKQAAVRFEYIRSQMEGLKFPEAADPAKLVLPTTVITQAVSRANNIQANTALDKPEGLVVHHVLQEVAALADRNGNLIYEGVDPEGKKHFDRIRNGGLKIITTVDSRIQQVAVQEASSASKESNMNGQKPNLQAALVAVEPGTGAVKAYYGGDKGSGNDYAGYYTDPVLGDGEPSCCGGHPPGSTFKIYTLATALMAGYSTDSMWNAVPQDFPGRTAAGKNQVKNAGEGTNPSCKSGSGQWCTLEEVTVKSYNVPFYAITLEVGAAKVIDTARAAGIGSMWATVKGQPLPQRIDLVAKSGKEVAPTYFGNEVGFGQYPVTVLDHAGGLATFAARGLAVKTHFLKEVWEENKRTYAEVFKPQRIPNFSEAMADALTNVLRGVPVSYGLKAAHGYQLAGKTGTWQLGSGTSQGNAHAWMGGYVPYDKAKNSPGLAAAVWVGNKGDEVAIKDKNNANIIGGKLPGPIWRDFMDAALTKVKMPKASFLPGKDVGPRDLGTGVSPQPSIPIDPMNPGGPGGGNGGGPGGGGGGVIPTPTRRGGR